MHKKDFPFDKVWWHLSSYEKDQVYFIMQNESLQKGTKGSGKQTGFPEYLHHI